MFFRNLVALQAEAEVAYTRFAERSWIDRLGLIETADAAHHPDLPTVFTLCPDLTIETAYNGYWFWGRPTNEELRRDFRSISRRIRPDWEPHAS